MVELTSTVSSKRMNFSGIFRTFCLFFFCLSSDWASATGAGSNLGANENESNSPTTIQLNGQVLCDTGSASIKVCNCRLGLQADQTDEMFCIYAHDIFMSKEHKLPFLEWIITPSGYKNRLVTIWWPHFKELFRILMKITTQVRKSSKMGSHFGRILLKRSHFPHCKAFDLQVRKAIFCLWKHWRADPRFTLVR